MEDVMRLVKSLEESGLLIKRKRVKKLKMKQKNKKVDFFQYYSGTLAAIILGMHYREKD